MRPVTRGGSWAAGDHTPGGAEFPITQTAAAYLSWLRAGAPAADRYRMTAGAAGSRIWIDSPAHVGELPPASAPRATPTGPTADPASTIACSPAFG
jgi:hypothetical protein